MPKSGGSDCNPVIHFTLAAAVGAELPLLLRGEVPDPPSSRIGSGNWSEPPRAPVLGGAYEDEDIARLEKLVEGMTPAARRIPWIRIAPPKPGGPPLGPAYALEVVARCKDGLKKLEAQGKLVEGEGGVHVV
jgi:hypothetical protein